MTTLRGMEIRDPADPLAGPAAPLTLEEVVT